MSACTCVCCELGTPEDCIACRTCGSSWCDWFGEHPAEHSNDEEEPMSDDRFADCRTPEDVLVRYRLSATPRDPKQFTADALARIRELQPPPTVSEEARERATDELVPFMAHHSIETRRETIDRIIDALGYTPTPDEFSDPANWHPIEEHPYLNDPPNRVTASPPVVELDADELQSLASLARWYAKALRGFDELVVKIGPIEAVIVRTGYDTVRVRIGGGDE